MPITRSLLVAVTSTLALLSLPSLARADTYVNINFPGPADVATLDGRVYLPDPMPEDPPAVIMVHGCGGMWSDNTPANGGVREIERWGRELAAQGYVALAVDSYSTRAPADVSVAAYQDQCSGKTYAGAVDPYTKRVDDIAAARAFLIDEYAIDSDGGLGLLGWSQGAQAVLIAMAATPRDANVAYSSPSPYAAAVAYYPGCGTLLGYGMTISTNLAGYWRPAAPMRMHMGTSDSFWGNCDRRADNAIDNYSADLTWVEFTGAKHNFDNTGTTAFPTAACTSTEWATSGMKDQCAMREADLDSLDFVLAEVVSG